MRNELIPPLLGYYTMAGGGVPAVPFVPTDITGLKLWIDFSDTDTLFTDAGTTKVTADGDAIYQANDKSGNNSNSTQATSGSRPLYKTGVKNGLSVARFDGSDDYLLANTNSVETADWSLFIVFDGSDNAGIFVSGRHDVTFNSGVNYGVGFAIYSGNYGLACKNNSVQLHFLVSDSSYSNWNLYAGRVKSGDSAQSVNGSSIGTSSETFNAPYTGYVPSIGRYIGTGATFGHPLNGDIGEILLYQPSISDADALKVNTYLNNKWSVY